MVAKRSLNGRFVSKSITCRSDSAWPLSSNFLTTPDRKRLLLVDYEVPQRPGEARESAAELGGRLMYFASLMRSESAKDSSIFRALPSKYSKPADPKLRYRGVKGFDILWPASIIPRQMLGCLPLKTDAYNLK